MAFQIHDATTVADLAGVAALFRQYADWLEEALDISPQTHGIDAEIEHLPRPYAPPDGALIAARSEGGTHVGCIGLRRLDEQSCEVKRLFVRPEQRGERLGEKLVAALIEKARTLGYSQVVLDVGEYQKPAIALYRKCGFREIAPKDHISYAGVVFMVYDL
ncbi:MAG: GNAT family N-acetyltransferase [Pikeienuella sp.]